MKLIIIILLLLLINSQFTENTVDFKVVKKVYGQIHLFATDLWEMNDSFGLEFWYSYFLVGVGDNTATFVTLCRDLSSDLVRLLLNKPKYFTKWTLALLAESGSVF